MAIDVKYSTSATATGGRNGSARTEGGQLQVTLGMPKELGGQGGAANPEQLFAMGYAGCFLSALKGAARQRTVAIPDGPTVTAIVGIGSRSEGGFGLTADLAVHLPRVPRDEAEQLAATAHQVCPYSNATRGNVDVSITIA